MTVATALAVSWNPLTNSKLSASPRASKRKMAFPVERVSPNSCIHTPLEKGIPRLRHGCYERITLRLLFGRQPAVQCRFWHECLHHRRNPNHQGGEWHQEQEC